MVVPICKPWQHRTVKSLGCARCVSASASHKTQTTLVAGVMPAFLAHTKPFASQRRGNHPKTIELHETGCSAMKDVTKRGTRKPGPRARRARPKHGILVSSIPTTQRPMELANLRLKGTRCSLANYKSLRATVKSVAVFESSTKTETTVDRRRMRRPCDIASSSIVAEKRFGVPINYRASNEPKEQGRRHLRRMNQCNNVWCRDSCREHPCP